MWSALVGFLGGVLVTLGAAWWLIQAYTGRVRRAERRARSVERMAEIGAMTGGLAHEIKNPLSTIGLNAQLLSEAIEDLPIDAEMRGRLSRRTGSLRREVERLRGILTDFLQFAGNVRPEARPCDINEIVEQLVDFFLPQAEKLGVRLRTQLWQGPLEASVDAALVKQAVLNLMLNGVQAISAGGADEQRPRELIMRTARADGRAREPAVELHVIDTGPGMDGPTLAKIFEPYFTTRSGGTGLGLPTARRLIEAHGGRMEVHSEPGRGTDFTITLPVRGAD